MKVFILLFLVTTSAHAEWMDEMAKPTYWDGFGTPNWKNGAFQPKPKPQQYTYEVDGQVMGTATVENNKTTFSDKYGREGVTAVEADGEIMYFDKNGKNIATIKKE